MLKKSISKINLNLYALDSKKFYSQYLTQFPTLSNGKLTIKYLRLYLRRNCQCNFPIKFPPRNNFVSLFLSTESFKTYTFDLSL